MILVDTSVVVELMKPAPNAKLEAWLSRQPPSSVFISTITEAELRHGAAIIPADVRRERLESAIGAMFAEDFAGRVLSFDGSAALVYGKIAQAAQRNGRSIGQLDAQVAAIAKSRGATLATGNPAHFEGCGLKVIDPWKD